MRGGKKGELSHIRNVLQVVNHTLLYSAMSSRSCNVQATATDASGWPLRQETTIKSAEEADQRMSQRSEYMRVICASPMQDKEMIAMVAEAKYRLRDSHTIFLHV
jgi:7-cyano-7-deazaguanine synthase in queuosine biosynthesis